MIFCKLYIYIYIYIYCIFYYLEKERTNKLIDSFNYKSFKVFKAMFLTIIWVLNIINSEIRIKPNFCGDV